MEETRKRRERQRVEHIFFMIHTEIVSFSSRLLDASSLVVVVVCLADSSATLLLFFIYSASTTTTVVRQWQGREHTNCTHSQSAKKMSPEI